jgi:hypothetical protein
MRVLSNLPSLACLGRPPLGNEHPRQPLQHKFGGKDTGGRNACSCTHLHVEPTSEVTEGFHRNWGPRIPALPLVAPGCRLLDLAAPTRTWLRISRCDGPVDTLRCRVWRIETTIPLLPYVPLPCSAYQRSSDRSLRFFLVIRMCPCEPSSTLERGEDAASSP